MCDIKDDDKYFQKKPYYQHKRLVVLADTSSQLCPYMLEDKFGEGINIVLAFYGLSLCKKVGSIITFQQFLQSKFDHKIRLIRVSANSKINQFEVVNDRKLGQSSRKQFGLYI